MQALKTYLFAFVFLCLFSCGLNAQITYQHYLNESLEWYERYAVAIWPGSNECYMGGDQITQKYYHIIGIDSVDGYNWYRIHNDRQITIYCGGGTTVYPPTGGMGVNFRIREDTTGKVWMRANDGAITMMYDFQPGIGIGDTLWMNNYYSFIEVASIDTLTLGQDTRLLYRSPCSNNFQPEYVIEGAFCSYGFLENYFFCAPMWDWNLSLVCLGKDGDTLNLESNYICGVPGHITVGLNEGDNPAIGVSWNPSKESLNLQNWVPYTRRQWSVRDITGREVARGDHLDAEISLPGMSSGIYIFYLQPSANQKPLAKKFFR